MATNPKQLNVSQFISKNSDDTTKCHVTCYFYIKDIKDQIEKCFKSSNNPKPTFTLKGQDLNFYLGINSCNQTKLFVNVTISYNGDILKESGGNI